MPIFEYECQTCDHLNTVLLKTSKQLPPPCTSCGSKDQKRLISNTAITKSVTERASDVSWIDRNLASRIKKKSKGNLNPTFKNALTYMNAQ